MELKLTKESVHRLQYKPNGPETQLVWGTGEDKNLGVALSPAGDHVWIARVYVVQPDQKSKKRLGRLFRRPLTIRDKSLDEARRERDIWKGEAAQGVDPIDKRRPGRGGDAEHGEERAKPATVADLIDIYMKEYVAKELEYGTEKRYRKLVTHIKEHLGAIPVMELNKGHLLAFRTALGQFRETFNKARKLVSGAYRKAQLLDWRHNGQLVVPQDGFNPVLLVPNYDTSATRKGGDPFEPDELQAFISVVEQYLRPDRVNPRGGLPPTRSAVALPLFLLHTGLRKNEGMGLSWQNLDLPKKSGWSGYIDLRRGAIRLVHHKTSRRKGPRWVPISPEALRVLNLMTGRDETWVFPGQIPGARIVTPEKTFQRLQREAGVRVRGLHQTRHTFIVRGLEEGAPIAALAKAVGHSTVYVTENYAHISDRAARVAAEVVGRSMGLQWSWLAEELPEAA